MGSESSGRENSSRDFSFESFLAPSPPPGRWDLFGYCSVSHQSPLKQSSRISVHMLTPDPQTVFQQTAWLTNKLDAAIAFANLSTAV